MAYVIGTSCIAHDDPSCLEDGGFPCVEACLVDGIYGTPGDLQLFVNTDECIDCGICYPTCPVNAIVNDYDSPETFRANAAYYHRPSTRA